MDSRNFLKSKSFSAASEISIELSFMIGDDERSRVVTQTLPLQRFEIGECRWVARSKVKSMDTRNQKIETSSFEGGEDKKMDGFFV